MHRYHVQEIDIKKEQLSYFVENQVFSSFLFCTELFQAVKFTCLSVAKINLNFFLAK